MQPNIKKILTCDQSLFRHISANFSCSDLGTKAEKVAYTSIPEPFALKESGSTTVSITNFTAIGTQRSVIERLYELQ